MIHNSGPYGPNDVPINMGAPVNMTQISSPMNIGNTLSNLAKMPTQTPQTSAPQYNMPDYSSFGHPPLNMGHPMSPFANYHPLNFETNYGQTNPNLQQDTSINTAQNGMLPMNLNVNSDQNPNLMNYHSFESKRIDINNPNYRDNYSRKMPINIPQIHTKAFHKHLGMDSNYRQYNAIQENPLHNEDLTKTMEKPLIDSNRRKSLENTVKLIENILINSTSKDKMRNIEPPVIMNVPHVDMPSKKTNNTMISTKHDVNASVDSTKAETSFKQLYGNIDKSQASIHSEDTETSHSKPETRNTNVKHVEKDVPPLDMNSLKIDMQITDSNVKCMESNKTKLQSTIHCKPLKSSLLNNNKPKLEVVQNEATDNESDSDSEAVVKGMKQEVDEIKVKVETVSTWTDPDNVKPFLRDDNAMERDHIDMNAVIIEGDNNVAEAMAAAKNGSKSNTYYECSHCNLIFKHPKRFIIHTKWHSFGLTNEKRQELAKEKEMRKTMKKEARIIERLNSKEVKDKSTEDGVHPCKDCDKVFKVKSSLKNHRQRYHPTRVRECKICNATVVGWMALREHLNTHTGGGGYQCPECPKRFKYAHSLAKHKDTHLEKTHGCEQCEKKFGSPALLKMHMKCHERTARGATFRCTYCGKGFFESYNLQVHERTHRNERPFLCDICNSSFGTNSSLKRHLKVSHSTSKPFSCPTCQRCFATANTRDRHTARAHGDLSVFGYACTLCPRRYRVCKDLQKHMYKIHPKVRSRGQDSEQD